MAEQYKLIHPIKHFRDFLDNQVRLDGRSFDKCRPIGMNIESFRNALGSSAIKIGNSNVICGIRAELTKPKTATPRRGYVVLNVDVSFSSPTTQSFNVGNELSDVLSCLIYNIIIDTECIKLEDLCIHARKLVWCLYIDIICLEVDGGVLDAAVLACVSALSNAKLPVVEYEEKTDKVQISREKVALKVNTAPVISTYGIFDNVILTDPTQDEEFVSSALVHLGVCKNAVAVFHKRGGVPIRRQEIDISMNSALLRAQEITELVNRFKNSNIS